MRTTTSPIALLALPALAYAVVLNDFTPRVENLPNACNKVYNQQIAGCMPTDFPNCSEACVKGLAAITQPVQSACGNAKVSGQNIITAFLNGQGPSALCTNAGTYLSGSGSGPGSSSAKAPPSSPPPPASTKSSPPTSSATTSSAVTTTTSTETEASSSASTVASTSSTSSEPSTTAVVDTTTTAAAMPSSTGIVMDTSSSPSPTSTKSSSSSEQTPANDHSGGGSPFDTQGNLRDTSAAATSLPALSFALTAAIAALSLHW